MRFLIVASLLSGCGGSLGTGSYAAPIADPGSRRHFATHEEAERLDMHGVYGTVVVIPKQAWTRCRCVWANS